MGSGRKLKQQWVPYTEWEDWLNGMWGKASANDEPKMLQHAIEFTGDHEKYGDAMGAVIHAWPRTMLNSLTNTSINRRAFLGHCAVTFATGIPEYITRMAWKQLTNEQRELADAQAQKHINEYERQNSRVHIDLGEPLLS